MKKILFVIVVLFLSSCDVDVKKCTYDVYQHGNKLPIIHEEYTFRLSDYCKDFSKEDMFFKLTDVSIVKGKYIKR